MERRDLTFDSAGDDCVAWLYPAAGAPSEMPIVVMAHGLSGTRRDCLGAFAERFAAAGFTALIFDHRGFGESGGELDLFDPTRQLEDWQAAIALARSLPGVDPARVVTFGSSMGGGNALAASAADPDVAAAISQVPFLDIVRQTYRSSPRVRARMLGAAIRGEHLPAVGQPSDAALINAPGGEEGWRRVVALGEDSRWRNRVSGTLAARAPIPARSPCRQTPLPLARLRRGGRSGRPARSGDRRCAPRPQGRATHLFRSRPLRHLRRPRA